MKPALTPGKKPFTIANTHLAAAIDAEWQQQKAFSSAAMPLTALAYTAIDRIAGNEAAIIEALLIYLDTDTLAYRAGPEEKLLLQRQGEQWDPILSWLQQRFDVGMQTTGGIMPLDQSPALHAAFQKYLQSLDAFRLSAVCVLASGYSSLVLAVAVMEKYVDAVAAFRISRLEENTQAEQWGEDPDTAGRAERTKTEINAAGRFLRLLEVG